MTKVAVVLSGCGVFDGSEIYESVLTLLRLDQAGVEYQCVAPNIQQLHVINHLTGEEDAGDVRNVLEEAARLARGDIKALSEVSADAFDAVIVPGGFGAAKNLSSFAERGPDCAVNEEFAEFIRAFRAAGKPIGFICIAPALLPKILGEGVTVTIGNDAGVSGAINTMGGLHKSCPVDDVVVDNDYKLVTTPAYMLAGRISEAAAGIFKLVDKVIELAD